MTTSEVTLVPEVSRSDYLAFLVVPVPTADRPSVTIVQQLRKRVISKKTYPDGGGGWGFAGLNSSEPLPPSPWGLFPLLSEGEGEGGGLLSFAGGEEG